MCFESVTGVAQPRSFERSISSENDLYFRSLPHVPAGRLGSAFPGAYLSDIDLFIGLWQPLRHDLDVSQCP